MSQTVGDFIIDRLHAWGVRRVYGYSGDGINGVMAALNRAEDKVRMIQARHEELAAFMACGHAKYGDELGVVITTSGPGAIHALNGLYDAKKDHMPVVAIIGQQARISLGSDFQQEVDLTNLYKDVSAYVQMITAPAQTHHVMDRAVRIALSERSVTCIVVPNDLQDVAMEQPPRKHGATYSGIGYRRPAMRAHDRDLDAAAEVLDDGKRVAILAGAGVKDAVDEVLEVADTLGAGLAKAILAKTMIPDDAPGVTGTVGLLGTEPSDNMMQACDTLLMVGTSFPYSEFLPDQEKVRGVQIDIDAANLGLRFPTEVNLQGDAGATLRALNKRLQRKSDRQWRERIEKDIEDWWKLLDKRADVTADPINPQKIFWALSPKLPDDAMLACDVASATNWYARYIKSRRGMIGFTSGGLATMGNAVPYAIAAKFCHPDRPAFVFVGDGAMQMNGNNGLITVAKYWREWDDSRFIVLVLNNRDLNQVSWEQRVMEGDPKFETSQDVPDLAYEEYAELLGLTGLLMEAPDDVDSVWDQALAADKPVVINAIVDANVPPLPPHMKLEQVKAFMSSIYKGDPEAGSEVKQSFKAMAAKYLKLS